MDVAFKIYFYLKKKSMLLAADAPTILNGFLNQSFITAPEKGIKNKEETRPLKEISTLFCAIPSIEWPFAHYVFDVLSSTKWIRV